MAISAAQVTDSGGRQSVGGFFLSELKAQRLGEQALSVWEVQTTTTRQVALGMLTNSKNYSLLVDYVLSHSNCNLHTVVEVGSAQGVHMVRTKRSEYRSRKSRIYEQDI